MNQESLARTSSRTQAIVEGALLGDIAIVFLFMRAYMPVLVIRPLIAAVAALPFVLLAQRRGLKVTILTAIAAYTLFSALVGPLLAIAAINVAVAGVLVGLGRRWGMGPALNTIWAGPVFAVLDLIIPTILSIIIFRYPIHPLVKSAQNSVALIFKFLRFILHLLSAPQSLIQQSHSWEHMAVQHWQIVFVGVYFVLGSLTIYLAVLVAEIVLNQMPEQVLVRQEAA